MRHVVTPFTILVDQREKRPFTFEGLKADYDQQYAPLVVKTSVGYLPTADYSIEGLTGNVLVERKSLDDLFLSLGTNRDRFERELDRLAAMPSGAFVVVEAPWQRIINEPPERSQLKPKTITRSVISYNFKYPAINWLFCAGRRHAEAMTFRILERAWKLNAKRISTDDEKETRPQRF